MRLESEMLTSVTRENGRVRKSRSCACATRVLVRVGDRLRPDCWRVSWPSRTGASDVSVLSSPLSASNRCTSDRRLYRTGVRYELEETFGDALSRVFSEERAPSGLVVPTADRLVRHRLSRSGSNSSTSRTLSRKQYRCTRQ